MIKRQCKGLLLIGLTLFAVVNLGVQSSAAAVVAESQKLTLVASIRPIALIAEELLQPFKAQSAHSVEIRVATLVPQNASPHHFAMKPSQVKLLLESPLVFWLGESFEPYLASPLEKRKTRMPLVDIAIENLQGIRLIAARATDTNDHHEPHYHHDSHHVHHGIYDPHLWWDSKNAETIAKAMVRHLSQLHPVHAQLFQKGLQDFQQRMNTARQSVSQLKLEPGTGFIIYHDYLFYLENELNVHSQRRIASSPEHKPSLRDLFALASLVKSHESGCIVTEPAANPKMIEKINGQQHFSVVVIDPLGWNADTYSGMWQQAVASIAHCLQR
ncbi:MAG: zinc ABC transporter substrate-binding protein [Pseudomonadales bacterium]|nr:zinc ABC transporter substrate-binding protein [Pseudomonadales bacterium]